MLIFKLRKKEIILSARVEKETRPGKICSHMTSYGCSILLISCYQPTVSTMRDEMLFFRRLSGNKHLELITNLVKREIIRYV